MFKKYWYFDADKGGSGGGDATDTGTHPDAADPQKLGAGKYFTQTDVDRIVAERLQRERQVQKEKDEENKRMADAEAAKKQGEWQKVAEQREAELKKMQADVRDKDIKLAAVQKGIKDPDYAVYLVNKAGEGADIEKILSDYANANSTQTTTAQTAQTGSATNPSTEKQFFTRTQLQDPTFYAANKDAIMTAAKEGRIKDE